MGQKVHPIGLRLGITQGWDSSWSSNPTSPTSQSYRHNLHIDLEIRNLIKQLFASKGGYVGKIGISKSSGTNVIDINMFGYVPIKIIRRKRPSLPETKPKVKQKPIYKSKFTAKKELQVQLTRLVDVLNKKHAPEIFTMNCVLVKGISNPHEKHRPKQRRPTYRHKKREFTLKNKKVTAFSGITLKRNSIKKKTKKQKGPVLAVYAAMQKFKFMNKNKYFSTLINLIYLACKTKQPQFIASFLARELSKTHIKRQRWLLNNVDIVCAFFYLKAELKGIRIQVCGRINKSKRSKKYITQHGTIPAQTISNPLQYGFDEAYTSFGSMGVKVWLAY